MQATKGTGRIVPLGSIQKVMRESIEAADDLIHETLTHFAGKKCGGASTIQKLK